MWCISAHLADAASNRWVIFPFTPADRLLHADVRTLRSLLCWLLLGTVSWRPTIVKWRQFSQSSRHSTIGTRQTEYHEALPPSANVQSHLHSSFADDGNASWYSVCRVSMVEWRLDCESCRHLTVVGLHDTGPWLLVLICLLVSLYRFICYNLYFIHLSAVASKHISCY